MTLSYSKAQQFRPGALNVQVNGVQIEDLYREWEARTRECAKLREDKERMSAQLKEQGKLINELKEKLKEKENAKSQY